MSWFPMGVNDAEEYLKYRPCHSQEVFKLIAAKLKKSYASCELLEKDFRWKLALDVGCGPGCGTVPLTEYFDKVVGIDNCKFQIAEAEKNYGRLYPDRLTFLTHDASKISQLYSESSVDLITVSQALHWFDRPAFYEECKKLLKPGGFLVAYGFGIHYLENPEADKIKKEFCFGTLREYGEPQILHLDDNYVRIFPEFQQYFSFAERDDSIVMRVETTLDDYIGYLKTWSAYRKLRQLYPEIEDPLINVYKRFKEAYYPDESPVVKRYANTFLLFGRKM